MTLSAGNPGENAKNGDPVRGRRSSFVRARASAQLGPTAQRSLLFGRDLGLDFDLFFDVLVLVLDAVLTFGGGTLSLVSPEILYHQN